MEESDSHKHTILVLQFRNEDGCVEDENAQTSLKWNHPRSAELSVLKQEFKLLPLKIKCDLYRCGLVCSNLPLPSALSKALVSPPAISSTVSLSLPSPRPYTPFFVWTLSSSPFLFVFASICIPSFLPSFLPSLLPLTKSPGHQSNVVSGPSEVHSVLHLAQLPLADPQAPGAGAAAAHAGTLPLLNPWLPGEEDAGGLTRW